MTGTGRTRPPRTDAQILATSDTITLPRAIADGRVERGPGAWEDYWLDGAMVNRFLLRLMRSDELIDLPISGPPKLAARGEQMLRVEAERGPSPESLP